MENAFARWISESLASLGYAIAFEHEPLEAEASFRRFYRVWPECKGATADSYVAMFSPPEKENNHQFTVLAGVFADQGVPVPSIRVADAALGYFLLSDLGSRHLADAYEENDTEPAMTAAIDTLVRIQTVRHPAIPNYEVARFRDELGIFREWFVEGLLRTAFPGERIGRALDALVQATQEQPQCCVHRDYHCRNLLYGPDGRFGVVDFQDALVGPVGYDLASLLRDCYHQFPESEIARWRSRYLSLAPFDLDAQQFSEQLDLTAVQRQLKAIGIFARLHLRDGKTSHLSDILPVLRRVIDVTARYPALHPIAGWLREIQPNAATVLAEIK